MKIRDLIEQLEMIETQYGDIPCLIDVEIDYVTASVEVDECSVEERDGYGLSVKLLM